MAATHCQNLHEHAERHWFLILQKHWWAKLRVLTPEVFRNFGIFQLSGLHRGGDRYRRQWEGPRYGIQDNNEILDFEKI